MTCSSTKPGAAHSWLCAVKYPHKRTAASSDYKASKASDCTIGAWVPKGDVRQTLGYEENMDLVNLEEFLDKAGDKATFGTYPPKDGVGKHFCCDWGRRTVDGKRLSWLWVFPDGKAKSSNKQMPPPDLIWTRKQIADAWNATKEPKVTAAWTRHVEIFSELAIPFCLPKPK
jgi:hypothetical protein